MDVKAIGIVRDYISEHLDKSDKPVVFEVYIVWKCKILQNWKYLISSDLYDGMYYELTYNGDKEEWYLDAYKKFENRCIPSIPNEETEQAIKNSFEHPERGTHYDSIEDLKADLEKY